MQEYHLQDSNNNSDGFLMCDKKYASMRPKLNFVF